MTSVYSLPPTSACDSVQRVIEILPVSRASDVSQVATMSGAALVLPLQ